MTDEAPTNGLPGEPGDAPTPGPAKPGEVDPRPDLPAAGPHADPDLVDTEKTPGTGALPEVGDGADGPVQPGSG